MGERYAALTEDRGDGRSRPHSYTVPVEATATVIVQRDSAGYYVRLTRVGNAYPEAVVVHGDTPEEAVAVALRGAGLRARRC